MSTERPKAKRLEIRERNVLGTPKKDKKKKKRGNPQSSYTRAVRPGERIRVFTCSAVLQWYRPRDRAIGSPIKNSENLGLLTFGDRQILVVRFCSNKRPDYSAPSDESFEIESFRSWRSFLVRIPRSVRVDVRRSWQIPLCRVHSSSQFERGSLFQSGTPILMFSRGGRGRESQFKNIG